MSGRMVRLEGGPGDGRRVFLLPSEDSVKVPFHIPPGGNFGVARYVPHPSFPEDVWVLDARASDPDVPRHSPQRLRLGVDDAGQDVRVLGYKGRLFTLGDLHRALDEHQVKHYGKPAEITLTTTLELDR